MKKYIIILVAMFGLSSAMAQSNDVDVIQGGLLVGTPNFKITDPLDFSQTNSAYLTSRVAAMGGAFVSLGADLSSMNINPAGLGMYRSSSFVASLAFASSNTYNNFNPYGNYSNSKSNLYLNNVGVTFNLSQRSSGLVSSSIGFSVNRMADYNYSSQYQVGGWDRSIVDFFAEQMYGIPEDWLFDDASINSYNNLDINLDEWGGILAYQTWLLEPRLEPDGETQWYNVNTIAPNATTFPVMNIDSRGGADEFSFSSGHNINNVFYFGFTFGVQTFSQRLDYYYEETYSHDTANNENYISDMQFGQELYSRGTGLNFKLGVIARPIPNLRIGAAYHSANWVTMRREYSAYMRSYFPRYIEEQKSAESLISVEEYGYASPSKLLFGASYMFGGFGVLSFDYDIVWNRSIRSRENDSGFNTIFNNLADNDFKTSSNFRVGLELRPTSNFYIRGGYAYYGSPYKKDLQDAGKIFDNPIRTTMQNFSAGIGFRVGQNTTLDISYIHSASNYTDYILYSYQVGNFSVDGPLVTDVEQMRNIVSATLVMNF